MVSVRKACAEDCQTVLPLISRLATGHDWKPLFCKAWQSGENSFGYVLEDNGRVVGFLGLIHSVRQIGEKEVAFCHTSSWIVEEQYRMHSLALLAPVIKMKDRQIVNLSASQDVHNICLKLGFGVLDTAMLLIPCAPVPFGMLCGFRTRIVSGADSVAPLLNAQHRRILEDHRNTPCRHLLLHKDGRDCYIVGTRILKKGLPFFRIHFLSDSALFLEGNGMLRAKIGMLTRSVALIMDKRFVHGETVPFSKEYHLPSQRMYKGEFVPPGSIDNLYSEYAIMEM